MVELVAAIVGFVFRHEIRNSFKNNYEKTLKQYNSTGDYRSDAVDKIQNMLHRVVSPTIEIGGILIITQKKDFPKVAVNLKIVLHREMQIK